MTKCDVCNEELTDVEKNTTIIGVLFNISKLDKDHSETKRIKEIFGKTEFNICYVCWLKSLGIKPIKN